MHDKTETEKRSYKKFQDGINRVVVVAGSTEDLLQHLEFGASGGFTRQIAHIVVDVSFPLNELVTQIGKSHRFGRSKVPEIYLLENRYLAGDAIRLRQFETRLLELGASSSRHLPVDKDEAGLFTGAGLHAILKVMENLTKSRNDIHDWILILCGGFKTSRVEGSINVKQETLSSRSACTGFLSRLLRVPLLVQELVMTEVMQEMQLRMNLSDAFGPFRCM